jgi:hypothetical protein
MCRKISNGWARLEGLTALAIKCTGFWEVLQQALVP